jgi:signal transduction histidine kinase
VDSAGARGLVPRATALLQRGVSLVDHGVRSQLGDLPAWPAAALDDLGLGPALRSATQRWGGTHRWVVTVEAAEASPRLPAPVEIALYRVAEEAVANAAHHAAASCVSVRLRRDREAVELRVVDDGTGFDAAHPASPALGLAAMRERLAPVGGQLVVASRPGAGVSVVARVPLTSELTSDLGSATSDPRGRDPDRT